MKIPLQVRKKIASDAVKIAQRYMAKRGWKSGDQLWPLVGSNSIGIDIGNAYWLKFQNQGTHSFIPWGLEGKIVPIPHIPSLFNPRTINFRFANGVGMPGYVHDKDIYEKLIWKNAKWKNPGIKATYFLNQALRQAVKNNLKLIHQYNPTYKLKNRVHDMSLIIPNTVDGEKG